MADQILAARIDGPSHHAAFAIAGLRQITAALCGQPPDKREQLQEKELWPGSMPKAVNSPSTG